MNTKKIQKAKIVHGDMNQDCTIIQNSVMDEIYQLMKAGDITGAMNMLDQQKKVIGTYHKYYPDYMIEIKNIFGTEVPYSKPLTKEALKKFPPSIKGKFKFPRKYSNFNSIKELLSYSYRTQTDIEINMIELKKMLGDIEDPYQQEITTLGDLSAGKWFIKHKQFPKAKPYRIVVGDSKESLDYILLRAVKITDNNEIIITNSEQQSDIKVEFVFDLINKKINFKFNFNNNERESRRSLLKYLKFISQIKSGEKLSVISLEENIVVASGIQGNINYCSNLGSIDNEISFLEDILLIEEKYSRIIVIPELINTDDLEAVAYLASGIRNGIVAGLWDSCIFDLELTEDTINSLKNIDNQPMNLNFERKLNIIIFGEKFEIPKLTRKFKSAIYDNIENIKRKLKVLDIGDTIKITLVPIGNNECEDIFDFSEKV